MRILDKIFHAGAKEAQVSVMEDSHPQPIAELPAKEESAATLDEEALQAIRDSLLFDGAWYRRQHGLGEYLDAARHYLMVGWKKGWDPSPFFSGEEYFARYPELRESGMNPLLHFERFGFVEGRYREELRARRAAIAEAHPECRTDMEGGILRIRITNACNAKCRYCGVRNTFGEEKEHAMDPRWYYEYCKPLYEKIHIVLITGGDAFVARESYNYMKFMSENYPAITLLTESNGIAFDERFRRLAADNLFKTHFSVNASTAEIFDRSCWEGSGGDIVYPKFMGNIDAYLELLKEEGKLCFAPSMSMVINHDNYGDVRDFTRMALRHHSWYTCFFFDYSENDMNSDYFGRPEEMRPVLKEMMEIERVLAGRIMFYFRLWIPGKEAEPLQEEVEAEPMEELRERYRDLLELSEGRSVEGEYRERNAWRRRMGKKELEFGEDFAPTVRLEEREGRRMCFAPWGELDLYPDGRLDFCGWFERTLDLHDFLADGKVDWEAALNSYEYMAARKRILCGNFRGCQVCCPMNSVKNPIVGVHQYGNDRLALR